MEKVCGRAVDKPRYHGQTIVLFALMSLVLIAGLGLVIDAGVNYAERRNMQNAADTAALAGARVIARKGTYAEVWSAVFNTAKSNGAPDDASRFECTFINNSRVDLGGASCASGTGTVPTNASGVRVRVSEEHNTFFMRAIGINTSGTAAVSMAQVQLVKVVDTVDVPFMVCGVYSPRGAATSILEAEEIVDTNVVQPSPSASPITRTKALEPARIKETAYGYDWNVRQPSGDPLLIAGAPEFLISAPTMTKAERCGVESVAWNGLIGPVAQAKNEKKNNPTLQSTANGDPERAEFIYGQAGLLPADGTGLPGCIEGVNTPNCTPKGPQHTINGTQGCPAGKNPNNCVLILPIVVFEPRAPLSPDGTYTISNDGTFTLDGRLWGAFYVTKTGSIYRGRLIKNYPMHTGGVSEWSPTYPNYRGPITVNLVK